MSIPWLVHWYFEILFSWCSRDLLPLCKSHVMVRFRTDERNLFSLLKWKGCWERGGGKVGTAFICCYKKNWQRQLKGVRLLLDHSSKMQSVTVGKTWQQKLEVSWSGLQSRNWKREISTGAQLTSSALFSPEPQSVEWGYLHLRPTFLAQLTQSRNSVIDMPRSPSLKQC